MSGEPVCDTCGETVHAIVCGTPARGMSDASRDALSAVLIAAHKRLAHPAPLAVGMRIRGTSSVIRSLEFHPEIPPAYPGGPLHPSFWLASLTEGCSDSISNPSGLEVFDPTLRGSQFINRPWPDKPEGYA